MVVHGDVPNSAVNLPAQVHELRSCIRRAYGNATVDVVGHSVGGVIAMLYTSEEPFSVRRVVSVEGNFTLKDAFWSGSLGRMSQLTGDTGIDGVTLVRSDSRA
jgi:pimeloyl-ACP methyl ester carboxylesterase